MKCPLCHNHTSNVEESCFNGKKYFTCSVCELIFLSPESYLVADEEKKRYALHENNINAKGYVDFLNRVIEPSLPYLEINMHGLDYGCGPDSVLAKLLNLQNINCDYYDPFFFPKLPNKTYDFIFATECFEHFFSPKNELETILSHLKSGGLLLIMTELNLNPNKFENWYYIRDPTHVCFYSPASFQYICQKFELEMVYSDGARVLILKKS